MSDTALENTSEQLRKAMRGFGKNNVFLNYENYGNLYKSL